MVKGGGGEKNGTLDTRLAKAYLNSEVEFCETTSRKRQRLEKDARKVNLDVNKIKIRRERERKPSIGYRKSKQRKTLW